MPDLGTIECRRKAPLPEEPCDSLYKSGMALYLHIPFCVSKCAYCDFASYPASLHLRPRYLLALAQELTLRRTQYGPVPIRSLFIGGGTPSLLTGREMEALLAAVRDAFPILPGAEITMEANPGTLREEDVSLYRRAGINRCSLGAQAAQEDLLHALGRRHRWSDVVRGVALLRAVGIQNLNLDLMFGLPGQSQAAWMDTLEAALTLGPEHLSCYGLQVEEGTVMHRRVQSGEAVLPPEAMERSMYDVALRRLERAGYGQYELSNFARPGFACRQNLTYWRRGFYLGVGCAAHSMMPCVKDSPEASGEERFGNPQALDAYLTAMAAGQDPAAERSSLTLEDARFETLMLGLRLAEGVSCDAFLCRFGCSLESVWGARLQRQIDGGFLTLEQGWLRLTRAGQDVQNTVLVSLM